MERTARNSFSVFVDGLVLPAPIGGHPALDFCNTLAGWDDPDPGDFLGTYDHLAAWAAGWDLIDDETAAAVRRRAAEQPGPARAALESARELRGSIYRVLSDPEPGHDLDLLADAARRAFEASELVVQDGDARWRLDATAGLRTPVHAVALAAEELLTGGHAASVRRCPGEECGWLFLDRSGRRRWCTMAMCGNRAKVRRFAERQRERRMAGSARDDVVGAAQENAGTARENVSRIGRDR